MQNNNERQEETRNLGQNLSEQANSAQGQNNVESGENLRSVIHRLNEDINQYRNICEDDIQDIKEGRVFVGDAFNQYRILEYETHISSLGMISGEVSKIIRELRDNKNIDKKQKLSELAGMRAQYEIIANTIDSLNKEMLKYEQISRSYPELELQNRITELDNDYRYMNELSNKIDNTNNDKKYEHARIIRDYLWEKTEDELQKLKKEQSDIVNKKIDKMISECKKRGHQFGIELLGEIREEFNNKGFSEALLRDYIGRISRWQQPSHIIYINKDAYKLIKDIESTRGEMKSILEYVKKNSFWGDEEDYSFYKNIDNEFNYLGELCKQLKTNIEKQEDTIPLDNNQVNLLNDSYNEYVDNRFEIQRIQDAMDLIKAFIDLYKHVEELEWQCVQRRGLFTNSESGKFDDIISNQERIMNSFIDRLVECKNDINEGARKILNQQTVSYEYLYDLNKKEEVIETDLATYNQETDRELILNPELRDALNEDYKWLYEDAAYEEGSDIETEEIAEFTRVEAAAPKDKVEGDTEGEVDIEPKEVADVTNTREGNRGFEDRGETTSIREGNIALSASKNENEQRKGMTLFKEQQENNTESRKGDLNAASTSGSNNMTAENRPDHDSTSISSNDSFLVEDSDATRSDFESSISSNNSNDSSLPTDTDQVQISVVEQNIEQSFLSDETVEGSTIGSDHDSADSVVSDSIDDSIISLNGLGIMENQLSVGLNPNPAPGPIGEIGGAAESDTTRSDDNAMNLNQEQNQTTLTEQGQNSVAVQNSEPSRLNDETVEGSTIGSDHDSTSISSNDSFFVADSDITEEAYWPTGSELSDLSNDSSLPTDTDQVQISVVEQNIEQSFLNGETVEGSTIGSDHDSADSVVSDSIDDSIISLNGLGIMENQLSVGLNPNPAPGPIGEIGQAAESDITRSDDNPMNLDLEQNQPNTTEQEQNSVAVQNPEPIHSSVGTAENGTTRSNSVVSDSSYYGILNTYTKSEDYDSIISLYAASESFGDRTYSKCSCFAPIKKMVKTTIRNMWAKCKQKCFTN